MKRCLVRILTLAVALASGACSASVGGATLSGAEASESIADALEAEIGQRPADVLCPDEVDGVEGTEFRCTLVAGDGSEIGLTATVTADDGTLDIQVDEEVSTPPSTG